jgi:serine protease Do
MSKRFFITKPLWGISLVLVVGWLVGVESGCAASGPGESALCADAPTTEHVTEGGQVLVEDMARMMRLQEEATKLIADGRTVKMAELIGGLGNRHCELGLSRAGEQAISPEELYRRMRKNVLIVSDIYKCPKCGKWHGTTAGGFAISKSGACVTNYHVVNNASRETLVVATADGRVLPVKAVLAGSKVDDVAIIQVDGLGVEPLALAAAPAEPGAAVWTISHPTGRFYSMTAGIVSRYFTMRGMGGRSGSAKKMAITADYARGSSGAPVFNDHGAVVGMVASTSSIYADEKDGRKENLQMVVKECVPSESILKLVGG